MIYDHSIAVKVFNTKRGANVIMKKEGMTEKHKHKHGVCVNLPPAG